MTTAPTLLAIDPGLRTVGAAIFRGPDLVAAALIRAGDDLKTTRSSEVWARMGALTEKWVRGVLGGGLPDHISIEKTTIYPTRGRGSKRDSKVPESLLQVTGTAGAIATRCSGPNTRIFRDELPSRWKGPVNKEIMWRRVGPKLSDYERSIVEFALRPHAKALHHNTLDAVMMGMFVVGRTARGGVS